jgi:putative ABC transport system substrate-binding protein
MYAMKKTAVPWVVVVILLAIAIIAEAQQPKRVSRIRYPTDLDSATESTRAQAIRLAVRERGHIEGQNIAIEYRCMEGKRDRASDLPAELVRLKVDIIVVAAGRGTIWAAKNVTTTIPVVMVGEGIDPVKAGSSQALLVPAATSPACGYLWESCSANRCCIASSYSASE